MERDAPLNPNHAALQSVFTGGQATDKLDLVTGAWSYLGRHVAAELLDRGRTVRSLTSRPVPDPDPFEGAVEARPWTWNKPALLREALAGVDTLYNTYWVRHTRPPVGHRGPWTSHDQAVARSRLLIDAAAAAGIRRVVHVSITQPDPGSPLPYFAGKAAVEAHLQGSGLSHAILRPSCFFGAGDILLNNIAHAVRRFRIFFLPSPTGYRIRPIHVGDMAGAMVRHGGMDGNVTRDACGPEQYAFDELVARMGPWLNRPPCRVVPLPMVACEWIYGAAGQVLRDTILSRDELLGLSSDLLGSDEEPLGTVRLSAWVRERRGTLGRRFQPEPPR